MVDDPNVVLRAHALRVTAARTALLHGHRAPRTARTGLAALWVSFAVGALALIAVVVTVRVMALLQQTGS
jgi:hypothetical protein